MEEIQLAGTAPVVTAKLQDALDGHARKHARDKQVFFGVLATIALGATLALYNGVALVYMIFGVVAVFFGAITCWQRLSRRAGVLGRADEVRAVLRLLARDVHPRSKILGRVRLTPPDQAAVERTEISPYSRSAKTYHRLRWFEARWMLPDGALVAVAVTEKVKMKNGGQMAREGQVHGRLRYPAGALDPAAIAKDALRVTDGARVRLRLVPVDGALDVQFAGTLSRVTDLDEVLAAVVARVAAGRIRAA